MKRIRVAAGLLLTGILAAGCSQSGPPEGDAPAPASASLGPSTAPTLADIPWGRWKVTQAAGEEPGAALRLTSSGDLARLCGVITGSWRADTTGNFAAITYGGSSACTPQDLVPLRWLEDAVTFRADGGDWLLLDADGAITARLSRGGTAPDPATAKTWGDDGPYPPPSPAEVAEYLAEPAALPSDLTPARLEEVVGRWVPVARGPAPAGTPFLSVDADGRWRSSDGCNGGGGLLRIGSGRVIAIAGPVAGVGCEHAVEVAGAVVDTARVGLTAEGHLVLVDADGERLLEFTPA